MEQRNYLEAVKEQYEELPYPTRDPEDERRRLIETWLDSLPMLNQHCFAGRQDFRDGFRILVAGGGTGDTTVYLGEQLRGTNAQIVHLDLSQKSIEVAQRRAAIRGLSSIVWINDSLLNLPQLGLAPFDYVNCSGVLHHLADPDAGLRALLSVLKPGGALGLMLYGKYGRTGVYQMQSLMRLINQGVSDRSAQIDNTRKTLAAVPPSNWFKASAALFNDVNSDAGIFDLLLHPQDRAYSVAEIHDWLSGEHGLTVRFTAVEQGASAYMPDIVCANADPALQERIAQLPADVQQHVAELASGRIFRHTFYALRQSQTQAPYGDKELVPYFFHEAVTGPELARMFEGHTKKQFPISHGQSGASRLLTTGKYWKYLLNQIDGQRSFAEIFDLVRSIPKFAANPPSDAELFDDFRELFDFLRAIDRLFLKHRTVNYPGPR